jgi:excisionase family DNA binding protein
MIEILVDVRQQIMTRKKNTSALLTPTQAAELLGVTPQGIIAAITRGRLSAQRYGRMYLIERLELENYQASVTTGRPPSRAKRSHKSKKTK